MENLNKILILVTMVIMLFALTGCGEGLSREERVELGNKQLEEKYNDTFTIESVGEVTSLNVYGLPYTVRSEKYPDEPIRVNLRGGFLDVQEITITDNYVALKYANETYDFIKGIVEKEFEESKIVFTVPWSGSNSLDKDSTLDEFLRDSKMSISFDLMLSESEYDNKDKIMEKCIDVVKAITEYNQNVRICVFLLDDVNYDNAKTGYLTHEEFCEIYLENDLEREDILLIFYDDHERLMYRWEGRFEEYEDTVINKELMIDNENK